MCIGDEDAMPDKDVRSAHQLRYQVNVSNSKGQKQQAKATKPTERIPTKPLTAQESFKTSWTVMMGQLRSKIAEASGKRAKEALSKLQAHLEDVYNDEVSSKRPSMRAVGRIDDSIGRADAAHSAGAAWIHPA